MNKRFMKVKQAIQKLVVKEDVFGLAPGSLLFLQETQLWRFRTSADKVKAYRDWLQRQIDDKILTTDVMGDKPWTATYVESSYRKGMNRAYVDTNKAKMVDYEGTREEFLRDAFGAPETLSKIELISTRAFEELKGVTASMSQQMSRTLADGLAAGRGPRSIARELRKRVEGITAKRARVIARTEVIHAHAEGQLDAFERLGVEEVGIMAEWSTAGDDRVCVECSALEGEVMTVKEARGRIPLHPNCRCAWTPATEKRRTADVLEYRLPEGLPDTPEVNRLLALEKTLKTKTAKLRKAYKAGDRSQRPALMRVKRELNDVRDKIATHAPGPKPVVTPKPVKIPKPAKALKPVVPRTPAPAGTVGTKFATAEDYRQYLIQQVKAAQDPATMKKIKELSDESKKIWKKWTNTYSSNPKHAIFQEAGLKIDKELKVLRKSVKLSKEAQRKLLDEVSSKINACELLADAKNLKKYQSVVDDILSWIPGKRKTTREFDWVNLARYSRGPNGNMGSYSTRSITMYMDSKQVFAHEFGHHMEYHLKGFLRAQNDFFKARTVGDKIRPLPGFERSGIVGKKDKWYKLDGRRSNYAGRVYLDGRAPEAASMGIEYLWKNPLKMATKDPEWFNMVISQLKGIPVRPGEAFKIGKAVKAGRGVVGRVMKPVVRQIPIKGTGAKLVAVDKKVLNGWSWFDQIYANITRVQRGLKPQLVTKTAVLKATKRLTKALEKLNGFNGTTYRGMIFDTAAKRTAFIKKLKTGSVWKSKTFLASSKSKVAIRKITKQKNSLTMVIRGKSGRDISKFAALPGEKEVLFMKDVILRIDKVVGNTIYLIEL